MQWLVYEHYAYAAVAVLGTALALLIVDRLARSPALARRLAPFAGVVPPFLNVNAMLFGLTLAFIAADTWSARDRAMDAVFREADSLRSLLVLAEAEAQPGRGTLEAAIRGYGVAAADEFTALQARETRPEAHAAADALLRLVAAPQTAQAGEAVHAEMLRQVMALRDDRDLRVSLSRTHLNPLKWLGMASLGFLTILSIWAVHLDRPRAATLAIALFALAAAPSAAIVLVQGNPFQPPAAITAEPILDAVR